MATGVVSKRRREDEDWGPSSLKKSRQEYGVPIDILPLSLRGPKPFIPKGIDAILEEPRKDSNGKRRREREEHEDEPAQKRTLPQTTNAQVTFRKPRLASYAPLFERFSEIKKKEYKKRKAKWAIPRKHEYFKKTFARGVESSGDKRIRALREALYQLDELGFRRSSHQREFHEAFIGSCLPQIYGEDFDRNLVKILRENTLDEIRCEIMVCCPRRWGKTMAVALFAAAYLWTQPEAEIIIYSIAKRTSSMLSSKIYNMIVKLSGGDHCVVTHNQEDMVIINMHGNESVLHSYPAASRISIFLCRCFMCVPRCGKSICFFRLDALERKKRKKRDHGKTFHNILCAGLLHRVVFLLVELFDAYFSGDIPRPVQRWRGRHGRFRHHGVDRVGVFQVHQRGFERGHQNRKEAFKKKEKKEK